MAKYECDQCGKPCKNKQGLAGHQNQSDCEPTYKEKGYEEFEVEDDGGDAEGSEGGEEDRSGSRESDNGRDDDGDGVDQSSDGDLFDLSFNAANQSNEDEAYDPGNDTTAESSDLSSGEDDGGQPDESSDISESLTDQDKQAIQDKIKPDSDLWKLPHDALNNLVQVVAERKYGRRPRDLTDKELERLAQSTEVVFDELVPDEYKQQSALATALISMVSVHASVLADMEPVQEQSGSSENSKEQDRDAGTDRDETPSNDEHSGSLW